VGAWVVAFRKAKTVGVWRDVVALREGRAERRMFWRSIVDSVERGKRWTYQLEGDAEVGCQACDG